MARKQASFWQSCLPNMCIHSHCCIWVVLHLLIWRRTNETLVDQFSATNIEDFVRAHLRRCAWEREREILTQGYNAGSKDRIITDHRVNKGLCWDFCVTQVKFYQRKRCRKAKLNELVSFVILRKVWTTEIGLFPCFYVIYNDWIVCDKLILMTSKIGKVNILENFFGCTGDIYYYPVRWDPRYSRFRGIHTWCYI